MGKNRGLYYRKKRSKAIPIIIVTLVVILAGGGGFAVYMNQAGKPVSPGSTDTVNVNVAAGTGTKGIAKLLEKNGLIKSPEAFEIQTAFNGYKEKYKAGDYLLSPGMSMEKIMDTIASGHVNTVRFTIPEGYDIRRITDKLSSEGLIQPDAFAKELENGVFDYPFLKDAPPGPNRLEGFLYPNTYDVFVNASEHDIIDRMLSQFNKEFKQEYYDQAKKMGLTVNQLITVASLVEREAKVDSERPLIASVIYNRLNKKMKLQIDATVQYALGDQKTRLYNKDLKIDSPYNTYKIQGLPPGPICSPGMKSIEAALNPAKTDYLYYVASPKLDGTHQFTDSGQQQQQFAKEYHKAADQAGL